MLFIHGIFKSLNNGKTGNDGSVLFLDWRIYKQKTEIFYHHKNKHFKGSRYVLASVNDVYYVIKRFCTSRTSTVQYKSNTVHCIEYTVIHVHKWTKNKSIVCYFA